MLVDVTHGIFSWYYPWQFQLVFPMAFSVPGSCTSFWVVDYKEKDYNSKPTIRSDVDDVT